MFCKLDRKKSPFSIVAGVAGGSRMRVNAGDDRRMNSVAKFRRLSHVERWWITGNVQQLIRIIASW